jgi:hypothetical protein
MKFTENQLEQIIIEEVEKLLQEQPKKYTTPLDAPAKTPEELAKIKKFNQLMKNRDAQKSGAPPTSGKPPMKKFDPKKRIDPWEKIPAMAPQGPAPVSGTIQSKGKPSVASSPSKPSIATPTQQPSQGPPIQPPPSQEVPKGEVPQESKQNFIKNFKLLRFMQDGIKNIQVPPMLAKMSKLAEEQGLAPLMKDLGIPQTFQIRTEGLLANPIDTLSSIMNEIVNDFERKANQKLSSQGGMTEEILKELKKILNEEINMENLEEELDFAHDPEQRLEKHKKKEEKKHKDELPPLNLSDEDWSKLQSMKKSIKKE